MNSLTKKYACAFLEGVGEEISREFVAYKPIVQECFQNEDFYKILVDPFLENSIKFEILKACLGVHNLKIQHFLSVLADADRLLLLIDIMEALETLLKLDSKHCSAVLFSSEKISSSLLERFKEQLENKLGCQIQFDEVLWDKDEVKCCLKELDLEVSFSQEKFNQDLKKFILVSFLQGVQIEE
ncbi:F0F1 ATP synthase subunit delta [Helicobacter kayseriensis]|uniref:F0F1 ATP synthase subunit delta n=1 Tax=Helicobacter kayseriensis TaxID=2905877 RepID=UPI001E64B010|nr:F0F1 ATP synthase subunit delta [Helicobacter kayseriensis]MCE3046891.1 F0F1 ATP synthase subunit delta [Helicobacter kayseriensis]MCE3048449.1 F0F1 ATP synthase subunit delta [Helicobacter kayseriensis]